VTLLPTLKNTHRPCSFTILSEAIHKTPCLLRPSGYYRFMKMRTHPVLGFGLAAFLAGLPAIAAENETENQPISDMDAGLTADAAPEEPAEIQEGPEAPEPSVQETAPMEGAELEDEVPPPKMSKFAKGNSEMGLSLAMAGSGDYFYFGAGASYDYFVINKLAPGMTVQYTHIFLSQDFGYSEPHTLTLLPFLKFVILESGSIAPYLVAAGGYQIEWGSKYAVNAWIVGGGAGVNVGIGEHVALNIQLLALYYWYDDQRIYGYSDDRIYRAANGTDFVCDNANQCDYDNGVFAYKNDDGQYQTCDETGNEDSCLYQTVYRCDENGENCIPPYNDPSDKSNEMFFPMITFGVSIFF
jgi:hypothetical protein